MNDFTKDQIKDRDEFVKLLESLRNELIDERNIILDSIRYLFPFYKRKLKVIDSKLDKLDVMVRILIVNQNVLGFRNE